MADISQKNNIAEQFSALPESIRKWLSSEELVFIISDIETKLGLSDEKILIIPNLILRLVVQDLDPQNFINELAKELGVDFSVAKTITEDIEKSALRPIAAELRDKLGLEVKVIYYGKEGVEKKTAPSIVSAPKAAPIPVPSAAGAIPSALPKTAEPQAKPMSPLTFTPSPLPPAKPAMPSPATATAAQPIRKEELTHESAAPFILHQESSPTAAPSLNPNASAGMSGAPQSSSLPKSSLTMKVQNYFQAAGAPERTVNKPISIKVEAPSAQQAITQTEQKISVTKQPIAPVSVPKPEIPATQMNQPVMPKLQPAQTNAPASQIPAANTADGQPRIVNYSSLRTPLDTLGLPKKDVSKDNVVDLRKFS